MLNKTILVFYINVTHLSASDARDVVLQVQNLSKPQKEDEEKVIQYIIPVRDQETRVECINAPIYISSEAHSEKILLKIKEMDDKLEKVVSQINAELESRKVITEKNV